MGAHFSRALCARNGDFRRSEAKDLCNSAGNDEIASECRDRSARKGRVLQDDKDYFAGAAPAAETQ